MMVQWLALLAHSKKVLEFKPADQPGPFCAKLECFPCGGRCILSAWMGFLPQYKTIQIRVSL